MADRTDAPELRGYIDVCSQTHCIGWAARGPGEIRLVVYVNGVLRASVVPRLPRPGIERAGIQNVNCGFRIEFDERLAVGDTVSVRDEVGAELPTSPQAAQPALAYHFVTEYRKMVEHVWAVHPPQEAVELAVGTGSVDTAGRIQLCTLLAAGLRPGIHFIEVGCGFGRLARNLMLMPGLTYLGTDVSERLVAFARELCRADGFRFAVVDSLKIPAPPASADIACAFSVFTHLLIEEIFCCLLEIERVLRPGGRFIFSFNSLTNAAGILTFEGNVARVQNRITDPPINTFQREEDLRFLLSRIPALRLVQVIPGDEAVIPITPEYTGPQLKPGLLPFGQNVCIVEKAASAACPPSA